MNIRKGNAQRGIGKSIEEASTSQDPAHSARLEAFVQQGEAFAPQKCVSSHLHLEMLQCMQYQSTRMLTTPKRARQGRLESSEKFGRNVLVVLILQIERESSPLSAVAFGAICFIRISTLLWLPVKKLWRSHVGFVGWFTSLRVKALRILFQPHPVSCSTAKARPNVLPPKRANFQHVFLILVTIK